ncbi:hypothetical protein IGI04_023244, partial [Brassica rapa subsp. trilocularis]
MNQALMVLTTKSCVTFQTCLKNLIPCIPSPKTSGYVRITLLRQCDPVFHLLSDLMKHCPNVLLSYLCFSEEHPQPVCEVSCIKRLFDWDSEDSFSETIHLLVVSFPLRKYGIHSTVQLRISLEFECAPDGGPGELAIFEAYLVAGFRGIVLSLVSEVSSFLGFCPSQLTPSSWKTLMSIQVLGELCGLNTRVHKILDSYYFAPLTIMPGFYHLQPRDGAPLVEEPSRVVGLLTTDFAFRCVSSGILSWGSRGEKDVGDSSTFPWSALPDEQGGPASQSSLGNIVRLLVYVLYDEYQQARARRRRPFYAPPPRLTRVTLPAARTRPLPTAIGDSPLIGVRQRLLTELFLLRNRVRVMAAQRDLLIWQEGHNAGILKKNIPGIYLVLKDRIITLEGALKTRRLHGDPKVLNNLGIFSFNFMGPYSAILGEATTGTCWGIAFYRSKPLSDLEGAGVGENPSARLFYFSRLE